MRLQEGHLGNATTATIPSPLRGGGAGGGMGGESRGQTLSQ